MHIHILATGGTIDKVYFDELSEFQVGHPSIEQVISHLNLGFSYNVESICRKDSLEIVDEDRQKLANAINASSSKNFLITHGTDTMAQTAEFLSKQCKDVTIVLTGAMLPGLFAQTDAVFNIGFALCAVQTVEPGVYIAMNGRVFKSGKVQKNYDLKRFEEK